MAKSILQTEKECFVCKTTSNRKQSEKYGMKVWLCQRHHTGTNGVHFNKELDTKLKQFAQGEFEKEIASRQDFKRIFGRNYL